MSTAPLGPAAGGGASASHAPAHAPDSVFDGEPVAALAADEPRTPTWLPLLGLALFVSGAVAWLAMGDPAPAGDAALPKPAETAAAVAPPPPAPLPQAPQAPAARPPGSGGGIANMSPEQLADLKKRIEEMRSKRGIGTPSPTMAPAAPPH